MYNIHLLLFAKANQTITRHIVKIVYKLIKIINLEAKYGQAGWKGFNKF